MATNLPSSSGWRVGRTCRSKMSPPRAASSSRVRLVVGMVESLGGLMGSFHSIARGDTGGPGDAVTAKLTGIPMMAPFSSSRRYDLTRLVQPEVARPHLQDEQAGSVPFADGRRQVPPVIVVELRAVRVVQELLILPGEVIGSEFPPRQLELLDPNHSWGEAELLLEVGQERRVIHI